jgi:hypothetical protein
MKRFLFVLLALAAAWLCQNRLDAQTTVTLTAADGTQIATGANSRGGLNLVEILADSPFNKNILNGNSGDTGFEYQNVVQMWQTQGGSGCTMTTTQWQSCINNAQFGPYTSNQWVNADFTVVLGPDAGYVGTVTANTASSPGTGTGAIFTVTPANSVAFQIGDVIRISTNCNMTNVCPTPSSQYTTNPYWGTWSTFNSATLGTDVNPTDLCATCGAQSMLITFGATNSFATIALQSGGGSLEKALVMNGTYTASVWAKSSTGTATVSGSVAARSGSNCTMSNQTVTTSWAQYTWTCNMTETTSGSGNAIFTFQVSAGGSTGTILFDNVSFSNNADTNASAFTNNLVSSLQAYAQKTQNTTGKLPTLRYSPDMSVTTLQNLLNNEMQQMPSPEGSQTNITGGTYTKTKVSIPEMLGLCQVAGYIPVLIMPINMSTSDMAYFADYLQGTNSGLPGVALRIAQGQTAPWVGTSGVFPYIYLEFGNENWNAAFIGEALGFRSGETGGVLGDYARLMGPLITAFRNEQTSQSYTQSQTFWVANAQTAANGSTMADTASNANPDLFEFDGYTSFGLDSVTATSCTNFSGTTCDLYMTSASEPYLNVHDSSSPHGFYQSLNEATSLNTCGPSHAAQCRASVYEENVYPVASTSGPVTQAVSDAYTQTGNQGVMFASQLLENATASFNGEGIEAQNGYHSNQFIQGEGGVNVHMWGMILDQGGDCSVTNSSVFGGFWCPRPQALGAEVANWSMIGPPVSCSQNSPTYTIPNMGTTNNNSLTIGQTVPYVTVYCFASAFPIVPGSTKITRVFVNRDPSNSYNIALAGTNQPTGSVTVYQYASPSLTSANELGGTTSISTNVINGTSSGIINSGPTSTSVPTSIPPQSVTAIQFTAPGSPLVTVDFGSRSGGTTVPAGMNGSNVSGIYESGTPYDGTKGSNLTALGAIALHHVRLFVDLNQDCPTSTTCNWSIPNAQLADLKTADASVQVLVNFVNTPSDLQSVTSSACSPPNNNSAYAVVINAFLSQATSGEIDSVEPGNEPDIGGHWCPSGGSGAYLSTYKSMIAVIGPAIKTANASLLIGVAPIGSLSDLSAWFGSGGVLASWSSPDFVPYHIYLTSTCSAWAACWASISSATAGNGFWFDQVQSTLTGQSYSGQIWVTEYNDGFSASSDCCRYDATYSAQWNTLYVANYLNAVNTYSATALPNRLYFFTNESTAANGWCLTGGTLLDCSNGNPSGTNLPNTPMPPYYAYSLFNTLNLPSGGHIANSVSPASTVSGVSAAAWYTTQGNSILIVNPTSSAQTSQPITINNTGYGAAVATQYLLNASNSTITSSSLSLTSAGGTSYTGTVTVPANSTLGILLQAAPSAGGRSFTLIP